ncbi:GNAT family N-acetyltransferase [Mucilaginibacter sp. McL0603]|uniref:GNAT family N-acetyltransferase n=1 Tax=Mucilaginibacter sp. McL0603 TaxID=3415670 RepID=UPI003CEEA159
MLTPIDIQPVRPSDSEELLSLSRKTFYDAFEHVNNPDDFEAYTSVAFRPEKILSEINNPHSAFYFASIDGEKVGYIKLNYSSAQTEFKDEDAVEVERIYVLASLQGKQIGKQMIDFAIAKAIEDKLKYIWLGVWEHNHSAIRFYEREGFKQFSSHEFWVGNDKQIDLLMKKDLQAKS